jgi:hypothetical protein
VSANKKPSQYGESGSSGSSGSSGQQGGPLSYKRILPGDSSVAAPQQQKSVDSVKLSNIKVETQVQVDIR